MKCALALVLIASPAWAQVDYNDNGTPWTHKAEKGPDVEAGGWYYNLGITGLRAELMPKEPTRLLIRYVFPGTPAHRKIVEGDVIVGVNGKPFVTPHRDGYGIKVFGGHGPLKDFGEALEASQGKTLRGKLTVHVLRKGKTVKVNLNVGTKYGRYGAAYPFDCKKSDRVLAELCAFIAGRQREDGSWGAPHTNTFAPLALLAGGNRKYLPHVKKAAEFHARTTKAVDKSSLIHWRYMAAAIVLSEYYLATKEKWVLPELREIHEFLKSTQYMKPSQIGESAKKRKRPRDDKQGIGGWGHNPGYEGYGPIAMITAQGALAFALMEKCGIEIDRKRHDLAYDFLARGTGKNGYLWYEDSVANDETWADMGRTGASALAHFLNPKYRKQALLHARVIGDHPETLPDTHGSPIMGLGYTALGAFIDRDSFRKMMDANRWWFTLARCADGTFYYQPNRDNNAGDFRQDARISASSAVALIFAAAKKSLRITGAR